MIKTHASLFSGIGAAEIAADWMGWQNAFHTKTDFTPWRGKIDILTAGFPCQPFSCAGQRKGADDDRYLWPEALRAVCEIQPSWFVGENVVGLLSMVQPGEEAKVGRTDALFQEDYVYRKEQRFTLDEICEGLERAGYAVQPFVIPACAVGAPHRRDRVWIVARLAAHPHGDRRRHWQDEQEPVSERGGTPDDSNGRKDGLASHANEYGHTPRREGEGAERARQDQIPLTGERAVGSQRSDGLPRLQRTAAHTESQQGERPGLEQRGPCQSEQGELGGGGREDCYELPADRWRDFPTQSPVCRGDDGISTRLAGITFPRWRAEAIKALGNAWVPAVAYEIFRAIAQVENEKHQST